jgi:DNA primase
MPANRIDFKHVREHASFEKVASRYGIKLTGKGDQRSALCTFHDEDTPSLKINVAKNIFHCFGCGKKGNVLDFVTFMEGGDPNVDRDLRAGAFALAEMCGIDPLPTTSARAHTDSRDDRPRAKVRKREEVPEPETAPAPPPKVLRGNKPLSFTLKLDAAHPYLAERGLSKSDIETFGLGMADRGLMKGRLAIPIHNEQGDLIAYAGRWGAKDVPKGIPKYLLPEGFEKQSVLFNLHRLPEKTETVILVESYFSVIRLQSLGIAVVSPMGHSVSEEQCTLLAGRGVERVVVLFDGDEAGAQGVAESLPLLARHFFVRASEVPTGFKPHRASQTELDAILAQ